MSATAHDVEGDPVVSRIAQYAAAVPPLGKETLRTAALCLADSLACAMAALGEPEFAHRLGPLVPGASVHGGVPVWGTGDVLDPVKAAADIGTLIRWLDFSDTTASGGHPSDCLGALLATADHASRAGGAPLRMGDVMSAMVGAYEIFGNLAAQNRFDDPAIGLDHVIGIKIAATAMCTRLLGGNAERIAAAVSNAFLDGHALNAYRHLPNAGSRKGWAGADAASRAVWLALNAVRGEMGYPRPLSAPVWGFEAVYLGGKPVRLDGALGSSVIAHVIFKLHPCQRNTSTAVESALRLHTWLAGRVDRVRRIVIHSHDEAIRRTAKTGPLTNRAARDHCIQYIVAVALLHGRLEHDDYSDQVAADPRIDFLRECTEIIENAAYTRDHHDRAVRSCANAIQLELDDGSLSPLEKTVFPAGDPCRRAQALPALRSKFITLTRAHWGAATQEAMLGLLNDVGALCGMPVPAFMDHIAAARH